MSAPSLDITVEPVESGTVVYGPLAPKSAGSKPNGQLSLQLRIHNEETTQVHVDELLISFIGSPAVTPVAIPLNLNVPAKETESWQFSTKNNIILPFPAPGKIKLALSCAGFDTPAVLVLPLAPHKNPTAAGSYRYPGKASDLRQGEYWTGTSAGHAAGVNQIFAYDIGVVGWDTKKKSWVGTLPGKAGDKNEHYRIWGKPIYAMADGTVVNFLNDCPNNPKPGEDLSPPNPGGGNHFWLQHGDELVLYAHLQKGSLNPALLSKGAQAKDGQFLGLAGNSGNSSNPHLHVHAQTGKPNYGPPRPLLYHGLFVIDRALIQSTDPDAPWVHVDDRCMPNVGTAAWPATTPPSWYPPGWAEIARHGIPEAEYQLEFERIAKSGYRVVWVDGYDVNGDTYFNVIFRPNDGTAWAARHGLTSSGYQKVFDTFTEQGFQLAHIESYLSNGDVRYAPIFVKSQGPAFTAYHGRSASEHQKLFDELTKDGWRPVNISPVVVGGDRTYAALYEQRDVGNYLAKSNLTPADYQTQFEENKEAGRRLVYLNAYTEGGSPRISAIWHQKPPATLSARHGLSSSQYQAEFDAQLAKGLLTRAVTGYEANNEHRFAAFWTK